MKSFENLTNFRASPPLTKLSNVNGAYGNVRCFNGDCKCQHENLNTVVGGGSLFKLDVLYISAEKQIILDLSMEERVAEAVVVMLCVYFVFNYYSIQRNLMLFFKQLCCHPSMSSYQCLRHTFLQIFKILNKSAMEFETNKYIFYFFRILIFPLYKHRFIYSDFFYAFHMVAYMLSNVLLILICHSTKINSL